MKGYLLIDPKANRIAKIDGTLIKEVGFGWGILGHLDRGGHFVVEQGDAGYGQWEVTRMGLSFTGKVLLFKALNIQSDEKFTELYAGGKKSELRGRGRTCKERSPRSINVPAMPGQRNVH